MLRTILVDDERPALKALEYLLKLSPDIEIIGAFTDVNEALQLLKNNNIQLLFLDIDMPQQNGIDVAKKVLAETGDIDIVFVTAYNHFAVDAFEVNVTDYILKPVSQKRLEKTLQRIIQKRTAFLNHILAGKMIDQEEIGSQGILLDIDKQYVDHVSNSNTLELERTELIAEETISLTARQKEVLKLMIQGLTYKEIGEIIGIRQTTIRYHINEIMNKFYLSNRSQLIAYVSHFNL